MTEKTSNTVLNATIFFLFGFLVGVAVLGTSISGSDISSFFIAVAAVYGVVKWRAQHDYQREKEDQRQIIKLVKKCSSYCFEWHIAQKLISDNLTSYINKKNDDLATEINKWIVKKGLERIEDCKDRLRDSCSELESEAATNSIVNNSRDLFFHIHCMLHRASDCISTANSTISVFQSFESLPYNKESDFKDIKEMAILEYKKFMLEAKNVENMLGIRNSTRTKARSYQALKDLDEAE
ncbi:hypothetical protein ABWH88_15590 [Marinobacter adhaerens]|nr:hypothetical protein [Marinobacter adhaerens]MBW4978837.1 hypothetical protein [Marinobacter adhaerens]